MNLLAKTLIFTTCLLCIYTAVLHVSGIKPRFAESNFIANQIRLQSVHQSTEGYNLVIVGSSLSARLDAELIKSEKPSLNLSLDGSSSVFGAEYALSIGKPIDTILIEMNTIYRKTVKNDEVLKNDIHSGTNRLASWFPLVKAEARPVTVLYSKLKEYKDSRMRSLLNIEDYDHLSTYVSQTGVVKSFTEVGRIENIISLFKQKKARVVLFFIPDGDRNNDEEKLLANYLSHRYGCEVLDIESEFAEGALNYTDGLHLSVPSARSVMELIKKILNPK